MKDTHGTKKKVINIKYEMLRRKNVVNQMHIIETKNKDRIDRLKYNLHDIPDRKFQAIAKPRVVTLPESKNLVVNFDRHSTVTQVSLVQQRSDFTVSKLRGVDPRRSHKYQDKGGTFTCHNEKVCFESSSDIF